MCVQPHKTVQQFKEFLLMLIFCVALGSVGMNSHLHLTQPFINE